MKNVKIILPLFAILTLVLLIKYFMSPDPSPSGIVEGEWELAEKEAQASGQKKDESEPDGGDELGKIHTREQYQIAVRELEEIKKSLSVRDEECQNAADKLFPDENLTNPQDKFFKNTDRVIEKFHDTFSQTLFRDESAEGLLVLSQMIKDKMPIEPNEVHAALKDFNICRPAQSLQFLEAVLQASRKQNYSKIVKKELFFIVYMAIEAMVEKFYTFSGLKFNLDLLKSSIDNQLVPSDLKVDLDLLYERLFDQEKIFKKGFNKEMSKVQKYDALAQDISSKEALGADIKIFARQMAQQYIPDFDIE